jgi:alginate O-acetyltransferase complex protein AlgI
MLFNSYTFVFAFLPVAALVFFLAGARSRSWAIRWLILASILFYVWWRPLNLLIIAPSVLVNYFAARALIRLGREERTGPARLVLVAGILFNILMLGYFKYANFFVDVTNDVWGTTYVLQHIVLPLGLSFITFQKIAFLVDAHSGRIDSLSFQEYILFVLFFPQLIAGPIVHFREMMPQFRATTCRFDLSNVSVGLTLFSLGLAKKVFLADGIAPTVSSLYEYAAGGGTVSFLTAWVAAVGFTLQIYFDFSGYTDMALGAARIFGIRLPPNFDSPLRSASIIEFWSRWHMTLTRFLTAYVYNPLSVAMTRRYLASGKSLTRPLQVPAFVQLLAGPTLVTMLISGLWHGAGYLFIIWGLLHGTYLVVNHAWRTYRPKSLARYAKIARPGAYILTGLCIVISMVVFRSTNIAAATEILKGMIGLGGGLIPAELSGRLGPIGAWLSGANGSAGREVEWPVMQTLAWLALMAAIAIGCQNSLQLLRAYEPALGWKVDVHRPAARKFQWQPSLAWAITVALIAALGVLHLGGQSEFLYWTF